MTTKSYAKVNIFLKIVGVRENYHKILSRFMLVKNLYDQLSFEKKDKADDEFVLLGDFGCKKEQNTIYKAFLALKDEKVEKFFKEHKVVINKNIPKFAGLGGGSSNAAAFLNLTNEVLDLRLSKDNLAKIGSKIGADVSFFIYNYTSANVSGVGEIVEIFDEEALEIETFTPKIECDTKEVYQKYRANFLNTIDAEFAKKLSTLQSCDILKNHNEAELNDLFLPSLSLYSKLETYRKKDWFFSGSGSTFFKVKNG